jgi:hypothetical protein
VVTAVGDDRDPDRAALVDGLQYIGPRQWIVREQLLALDDPSAGHRNTVRHQRILGQLLVDGDDRSGEAGMGVAKPHQVHEALHGPVLARNAVERVENDIGRSLDEPRRHLPVHVDPGDAVATLLERLRDAVTRHQRNRPLIGPAAHQDGDVELAVENHGRPTLWISHSSPTPLDA